MPTFKGTVNPQLNSRRYSDDKRNGWTTEEVYEGERENILRLAGRFSVVADQLDINTEGPTATMTARYARDNTQPQNPNNEVIPTTWELLGQSVQRSVDENPKANVIQDFRDIAHIKREAKKLVDPNLSYALTDATGTSLPSGASWGSIHKVLLVKYALGQENTITTEWVLRKSQVVTTTYELELATAGIDQVWTHGLLLKGETDVPVALVKSVAAVDKSTQNAFAASGDVLNGLSYRWNYGWLKQAPQMTYTTGGTVERQQEWWLNYWFSFDYPLFS